MGANVECTAMSIERRLGGLEKAAATQTATMEAEPVRGYRRALLQHPDLLELLRLANEGDRAAKEKFGFRARELGIVLADGTIDAEAAKKARIARLYYERAVAAGDEAAAVRLADRIRALGFEV